MAKAKLSLRVVPEPWAVLYVHPMTGELEEQGRRCSNCFMWAQSEQRCAIMPKETLVPGRAVCGYHVAGRPMGRLQDLPNVEFIEPLQPETAGFETDIPSDGTMCGNCSHYISSKKNKKNGFCGVVTGDNDSTPLRSAEVKFYGCCARWESRGAI